FTLDLLAQRRSATSTWDELLLMHDNEAAVLFGRNKGIALMLSRALMRGIAGASELLRFLSTAARWG
ncbi:MAG: hypothetical protein ACREOK_10345, partial [Gemmatimonadaceae bacterium]